MKIDLYQGVPADLLPLRGNPPPVRGLALVFENGRARVMVQGPMSEQWAEALSAPAASPDGVACAIDLSADHGVVFVDLGLVNAP